MKKEILNLICCPVCTSRLELQNALIGDIEIEKANLFCLKCNRKFEVNKGIIFLYEDLSDEVINERNALKKEIKEQQKQLSYQNEDWLLSFPDVKNNGFDLRTERITRLISENTVHSLKRFIKDKNLSILEIGAGNCWLTNKLAVENYCIALDMFLDPPKGLEFGNLFIKNKKSYFERIVADMMKLPFQNEVFDIVVISSALHHSSDLSKTLNEINRVLKKEGTLLLFNEPSIGIIAGKERLNIENDLVNGVSENRYQLRDWRRAIKGAGFKVNFYLPENIINVLQYKNGIYKFIGLIFKKIPKKILNFFLSLIDLFVLKTFDGFFNAVAMKKKS